MYLAEFFTIMVVHLLAVASPGPDFAIVVKQSVNLGRRNAIYTSLGIALGILVHVTYSLVGIGLIIASNPLFLTILKYIAAAYFLYIAWHGLRAKPSVVKTTADSLSLNQESIKKSFVTGFLINALNIKATLFFVALYSMVISVETPTSIKLIYGLYMVVATGLWFCTLSYMLSMTKIRTILLSKGYWVDRLMGLVLLILAIDIITTT